MRRRRPLAARWCAVLLAGCGCSSGPTSRSRRRSSRSTPQIAARAGLEPAHRQRAVSAGGRGQRRRVHRGRAATAACVALEADSGRELWRASVGAQAERRRRQRRPLRRGRHARQRAGRARGRPGAVAQARSARASTTAPLVAGERVFVLGVDRAVQAFDALDGRKLWTLQRPGDPLTLAQAGVHRRLQGHPARRPGAAAGRRRSAARRRCAGRCRSARRAAPTRSSGWPTWSARRCASATRVCARVVPGGGRLRRCRARHAALDASNVGGTDGGRRRRASCVFGADATRSHHRLAARPAATSPGPSETLLYRGLSAPLAIGSAVVFGDVEGSVHFLSRDKGETLLRLTTDGSAGRRRRRSRRRHDDARGHAQRRPVRLPARMSAAERRHA